MSKNSWIIIVIITILIISVGIYYIWKKTANKSNNMSTKTTSGVFFDGKYIDTHAHIITDRFSLAQAVGIIKKAGIEKMIVMQTPVDLSHIATPESHGVPAAQEEYPDQFAVMYQGDALVMLHQAVGKDSFTQAEEDQFKNLAEEAAKSGQYIGFGELALRHYTQPDIKDEAQREARDITIAGDHPWMFILSDLAAKYNIVLDVHIEPDSSTLVGFEKLIVHNPNTKIIFDHAGWYNTGEATAELFDSLLGKYSNLYTSIKLRKSANENQAKVAILDDNGEIKSTWLSVFKKYPDRFMIGTDVKLGLDGGEGKYDQIFKTTKQFLNDLPDDLAQKIASENAKKVFNFK